MCYLLTSLQEHWILEFGANSFLVSKAIYRCHYRISSLISNLENGNLLSLQYLINNLKYSITGSVANYKGDEYSSYSSVKGYWMIFGTQAINIKEFIEALLRELRLYSLCVYIENDYSDYLDENNHNNYY